MLIAAFGALSWLAVEGRLARQAPGAALPACALALILAIAPPPARHLRTVGWALVAATTASAAILAAMPG
jgi:hypothetical protein